MTMPLTAPRDDAHAPSPNAPDVHATARRAVRLVRAGAALYRALDPAGRILGHIALIEDRDGQRYRAQRYHAATGRFRALGSFWSMDDAVDCLRPTA